MVIEVAVSRDGPHLIEPNAKLRNGLQVARTLMNVQCGVGIVRVTKPTLYPVTLHRNTKLGWATSIHDAQLGVAESEGSAESEGLHFETGPHLQSSEQGELMALIQRFRHLFIGRCNPIPRTITEHEIDMGDASIVHQTRTSISHLRET